MLGRPPGEQWRLVLSAARRLDAGHQQIERVREGVDSMPAMGSPAGRRRLYEVLGDAEMAIIAINRALDIAASLTGAIDFRCGSRPQ